VADGEEIIDLLSSSSDEEGEEAGECGNQQPGDVQVKQEQPAASTPAPADAVAAVMSVPPAADEAAEPGQQLEQRQEQQQEQQQQEQPQQQDLFSLLLCAAARPGIAAAGITARLAASFSALLDTLPPEEQAPKVGWGSEFAVMRALAGCRTRGLYQSGFELSTKTFLRLRRRRACGVC
jgi:hypothetical protein